MSNSIYRALSTLDLHINDTIVEGFVTMVLSWEVRRTHPIALNSQTIGVHPIAFTDADRTEFFNLLSLDQRQVKLLVQKISAINAEFRVLSDPFNLLSIWLLHLGFRDISDATKREVFLMAVAKFLHYRFFTSLINHYYPYGAVERFMTATINRLSRKYDIIIYGTWKLAIEARCHDLISTGSIHRAALERADDDKSFLYALQDTNSRIRDKIKNVTEVYYAVRHDGEAIGSRSATSEIEGEKVLVHSARTFDIMIHTLLTEIKTEHLFLDHTTISSIATQFNNVTVDILSSALRSMVAIANEQSDNKQLELVRTNEGSEIYIGMRVFITNLIQKSYRYCMHDGVDITNRAAVFIKIKNVYSSSRISDPDILSIKQSVTYLVDLISTSRRDTTKSSLRLAIILYLITRSFRYL